MKKLITPEGYILLINQEGSKELIGQIRHGITFNLFKCLPKKVSSVEFKHRGFTDTFYFHNENPVFHHLTSRDNVPGLTRVYLNFFAEENNYTPEAFVTYIARNYFAKELGYQIPGEINA